MRNLVAFFCLSLWGARLAEASDLAFARIIFNAVATGVSTFCVATGLAGMAAPVGIVWNERSR